MRKTEYPEMLAPNDNDGNAFCHKIYDIGNLIQQMDTIHYNIKNFLSHFIYLSKRIET